MLFFCILLNKSVFSINSLILLYYLSIIHYHIYEIYKCRKWWELKNWIKQNRNNTDNIFSSFLPYQIKHPLLFLLHLRCEFWNIFNSYLITEFWIFVYFFDQTNYSDSLCCVHLITPFYMLCFLDKISIDLFWKEINISNREMLGFNPQILRIISGRFFSIRFYIPYMPKNFYGFNVEICS